VAPAHRLQEAAVEDRIHVAIAGEQVAAVRLRDGSHAYSSSASLMTAVFVLPRAAPLHHRWLLRCARPLGGEVLAAVGRHREGVFVSDTY
jgi:hypothetical protein